MGLLLLRQIVHEETKREIIAGIAPALDGHDPKDPETARRVVLQAREIAIGKGFANDNLLIAEVLKEAGVHHIPVTAPNLSGPNFLNRTTYPKLFEATDHLEYDNMTNFVKVVGGVVDTYTPDALYAERGLVVHGLVASVIRNTSMRFIPRTNTFAIGENTVSTVLMPRDPALEPEGWTVSPYARTLAPFIIKQAS